MLCHFMFVNINLSSVCVAEWPLFGTLSIGSATMIFHSPTKPQRIRIEQMRPVQIQNSLLLEFCTIYYLSPKTTVVLSRLCGCQNVYAPLLFA